MTIVFEPLNIPGTGVSTLPLPVSSGTDATGSRGASAAWFATYGYSYDSGAGSSSVLLRTAGAGGGPSGFGGNGVGTSFSVRPISYGSGFDILPDIGVGVSSPLFVLVASTYAIDIDGSGASNAPLIAFGSDVTDGYARSLVPLRGIGTDLLPPVMDDYALLYQGQGWMVLTSGYLSFLVSDGAAASDTASGALTFQVFEAAVAATQAASGLIGANSVLESLLASDTASMSLLLVAEATAAAADDAVAAFDMLMLAADFASASASAGSTFVDAAIAVSALANAYDASAVALWLSALEAGVAADTADIPSFVKLAVALDAATATSDAAVGMQLLFVAEDQGVAASDVGSSLTALISALDTGLAVGRVSIGGDIYVAYAMGVLGAATTEYTLQHNSYAVIDGHLYGASDAGLFLLEGDDDAGAPINASVRVGLSALGTQLKKAVPDAYIGYTSDGTLLFKVSTTDKGVKRTNVYKLNPVPKSTVSDNRFRISKGLHSVYWDFELANYEGSDFELDTIQVWRMALNRRK